MKKLENVIIGYSTNNITSIIGENTNKSFSDNSFIDLLKVSNCIIIRNKKTDKTIIG